MSSQNYIQPWIPSISLITDGESVNAENVNNVFEPMLARDQYLYDQLNNLQDKSALVALGLPLAPSELSPNTQVILPGYLFTVFFVNNTNTGDYGIKRAISQFTNSYSTSFFSPANSAYACGIVQAVYSNNTVDIQLEGLINLTVSINDPTYGMLDFVSAGVRETFRPGPYYLSNKNPGYVTANPSGISVFIGYAIDVNTFLLRPKTDEFSQLFANYQYDILDRPTATPVLTGSTWTIPSSTLNRLGWVDVTTLPSSYVIPAGACFLYNIPSSFATDNSDNSGTTGQTYGTTEFTDSGASFQSGLVGYNLTIQNVGVFPITAVVSTTQLTITGTPAAATGLTYSIGSVSPAQETAATQLFGLLPPDPANFVELTVNGVKQMAVTAIDPDGLYTIDEYGIWWYSRTNPYQPWSTDLNTTSPGSTWIPSYWPTYKGSAADRPRTYIIFAKLNPNLNTAVVTSLAPYPDGTVNNLNIVNSTTLLPATSGPLYLQTSVVFDTPNVLTTAPTAISALTWNQATGKLTQATTPIVSSLTAAPNSGITVTQTAPNSGSYTLGFNNQGVTGPLDSLEPINSTLQFLGLNSYLRLPNVFTPQYGFIGKVLLPFLFPPNQPLYIVVHGFGSSNVGGTAQSVGLSFEYSCSTCQNGSAPSLIKTTNSTGSGTILTTTTSTTGSGPSLFTFSSGYLANTVEVFQTTQFIIPAASIGPDSIVNFRVYRQTVSSNAYTGDFNVLDVYWSLTPI